MKATALILSAALVSPLFAQNQRMPRPRVVAPPEQRAESPAEPPAAVIEGNITVRLDGTTTSGNEIDLSLTGIGPVFSASQLVGAEQSHISCEYSVTQAGEAFRVKYTISVRQKVATSVHKDTTNYEFISVTSQGTVLCQPGKPVVIVRNDAKPLQLTVGPEAAIGEK